MPNASADNAHRVEPTPRGEFFKVFGRLMHRTARPSVHVRRCRRHLYRVRLELRSKYRDSDIPDERSAAEHRGMPQAPAGAHRHDSDVDIVLVFAGARPDYDKQAAVWRDVEVVQWNAYADLKKPRVEITSFAYWQEEFDEPDKPI